MTKHCCIVGGGAALAQPLIAKWLMEGHRVTAVCQTTLPDHPDQAGMTVARTGTAACLVRGVDLLVTMTGATEDTKLDKMTEYAWCHVIGSVLDTVGWAFRKIQLYDGANVVVVGSILGSTGGYGCASYAAAKAGLVGLVRAAANEWASRNICVNLLELGYTNAGMGSRLDAKVKERIMGTIPLRRFAEPHEVVDAVEWLGRVRYATGTIVNLAGGLR